LKDATVNRREVLDLVQPHLREMPAYEPVEPIDVVAARLGIPEKQIAKLDGNENPYGPSPRVAEALGSYGYYHIYPDPAQGKVRQAVARYVGAEPEQIFFGVGSDEILSILAQIILAPGDRLVTAPPTFGMYEFLGHVRDAGVVNVPRREDFSLDTPELQRALAGAKMVFLASPNNPTGNPLPGEELESLLKQDALVVVDEAYAEFSGESAVDLIARHDNLVVIRTFSKWAGLAGLRIGFAVMSPSLIDLIWRIKVPYNLSVAAEQAVLVSLEDRETLMRNVQLILGERERMFERLRAISWLRPYPSAANFILCDVSGIEARTVRDELRRQGILIRYFDSPMLRNCIRVSVGKPEHTDRLIEALDQIGGGVRG
jgi:histidinol-phosphate aminotransferase